MTVAHVTAELRRQVRADAGLRCGYCRTSEQLTGMPHNIEHIIPVAAGGTSRRDNLWLACYRCNEFKGNRTDAVDPETAARAPLFNPRQQRWTDHFSWSVSGTHIIGLTPCGRATVEALRLNNAHIVGARRFWIEAGWHPPAE